MFVYRREAVVPPPYPPSLRTVFERAKRLVVTIKGEHDAFVSGIHLRQQHVASYHRDYFHPREALIGETPVKIEKVSHLREDHRLYEIAVPPDSSFISVGESTPPVDDFVFQIGVRNSVPSTISVGIIEPLSKYVDRPNQISIDTTSESGSGVFYSNGYFLGMTMGKLSPDIMVGVPILDLLNMDYPIPGA